MSKTIDQRVVEMRFDNQNFERNIQTSMSTLDKLKQSLNLTGAAKGLENISAAAKNNNLSTLGNAAETVGLKFNAMYTMADQALRNITNRAMAAAESMLKALTIEPITTGFNEYELKMDSIKTIVASTGEELSTVNKYLEELNEYSDQTIYSFADMTQNIGKFTNAGVKLEDAVMAIKGISNEAAVSGANANEASRAMYNFAQALSAGYVKLIDWKSIENANMATVEFKQQLIDTALELGTVTKAADGMYQTLDGNAFSATQNFNEVFQDQWMTSEVLIKTLKNYADETTDIGKKAKAAAQDVTKLTQVYDILKETAQSGWAKTWELIVGDLDQAKAIFTPLTNFLSGIIDGISDARNNLLEAVLDSPFGAIVDKINEVTKVTETVVDMTEEYAAVVQKVIGGEYGDGEDRWRKLCDEGYNWAKVQNMVNEQLGVSVRHNEKLWATQEKTNKTQAVTIEQLAEMSDGQLRSYGFTTEQIQALKDLKVAAEQAGYTVKDVVANPELLSGRSLLIDGFKNLGKVIVDVFKIAKGAWETIFPPKPIEERAAKIYDLIAAFRKFTSGLQLFEKDGKTLNETGEKLIRTFKGIFAAVDLVLTVVGGPLKLIFSTVVGLLKEFDIDILSVTASIGDALVALRDWVDNNNILVKGLVVIINALKKAYNAVKNWSKGLKGASPKEVADAIISGLANAITYIGSIFAQLKAYVVNEAMKIGGYVSEGLGLGVRDKIKFVWDVIVELAKSAIEKFREITGIHSPSTVFYALGGFLVVGLLMGIKAFAPQVWDYIRNFASECIGIFEGVDFGAIFTALMSAGILTAAIKFATAFKNLTKPMEGFAEMLESFGVAAKRASTGVKKFLTGLGKLSSGLGFKFRAEGIFKISLAIAVLAGSVFLLAQLNGGQLAKALVAVSLLTGLIIALMVVIDKLNNAEGINDAIRDGLSFTSLIAIAASMLLVAIALKKLSDIDEDKIVQAIGSFVIIIGSIAGLIAVMGKTVKGKTAQNFKQFGSVLIKFALTMFLLVGVMKFAAGLSKQEYTQGGLILGSLIASVVGMVTLLSLVNKKLGGTNFTKLGSSLLKISATLFLLVGVMKFAGSLSKQEYTQGGIILGALVLGVLGVVTLLALINKKLEITDFNSLGGSLVKISLAMLLLVGVMKFAGSLSSEEATRGGIIMAALAGAIIGMVALLALINKRIGSASTDKLGRTLLAISGSMLILTFVLKLIGNMEWSEIGKGVVGVAALGLFISGLIWATKLASGKDLAKLGTTLLLLSVSIAILSGVAAMLGMLKLDHLAKGVVAVGLLAGMMAILVAATGKAQNCVGTLIALTAAVAVMAVAVGVLSFIDPTKLATATAAVSAVMLMFALLVKSSNNVKGSLPTLIALSAAVVLLGAVLYVLADLESETLLTSALSLSALLLALSGAMVILSHINAGKALGAVVALLAMAVPLVAFVGVLALMQNLDNAWRNVGVLVALTAALTLLLIPLTIIGTFAVNALFGVVSLLAMAVPLVAFVGVLALMEGLENAQRNTDALVKLTTALTLLLIPLALIGAFVVAALSGVVSLLAMAVPLVAFVGILALMENLDNAQANADLLINMMSKLTGLLAILAIIGPFALVGEAAMVGLIALIGAVGVFATAIGALCDKYPQLEEFLNKGLGLLSDVAYGIGDFAGSLIAGFVDGVMETLPNIGTKLTEFMTNAQGFITGAKSIDEGVVTGVSCLAKALLAITAAELIAGIANFVSGGLSFGELGSELSAFMTNASAFIEGAKGLDEGILTGVNALAKTILILTATDIIQGLASWLTGGSSLASFGAQLPALGANIAAFAANLGTFTEAQASAIACAAEAVVKLADAANRIPNEGGWVAKILGDNSIATFSGYLPQLGTNLASFVTNLGTFTDAQVTTVACASNAIVKLAEAASKIPNEGGWAAKILGDNSLATFGNKLASLGTNLASFVTNLGTFDEGQVDTVKCASNAIVKIAEAASNIPNEGGWAAKIFGDNSLADFGSKLPGLGTSLKNFAANLGTFNEDKVATVSSAVSAIGAFADLAGKDLKTAKNQLDGFGDKIVDLGSDIRAFVEKLPATSSVNTALDNIDNILDAINDLSKANASGATSFTNSLKNIAKDAITAFIKVFTAKKADVTKEVKLLVDAAIKAIEATESDMKKAGKELIDKLVAGIEDKKKSVKDAASSAAKGGKDAIRDCYSSWKKAGEYLADGFANGIDENAFKAKAEAIAMAKAALNAAEEALGIESPSKEFFGVGEFTVAGFVNALISGTSDVVAASGTIADSAKQGLNDAISKVLSVLDADVDMSPTIRPVLDLSGVKTGIGAIDSMFGSTYSVGAMGNIRAINAMMGQNGQNGNDDVVSAINKLGKQLGNVGNTTNYINGITYDDGSNVTDAVNTLVRAAMMEGRI